MAGQKVHDLFRALKIQTVEHAHPAVFTVEAMMPYMDKFPAGARPVKNLFLKDKKKGHVLVTALVDSKTDFKVLGAAFGNANFRMAEEKDLIEILGVGKGAASPFAVINDK